MLLLCAPFPVSCLGPCPPVHPAILFLLLPLPLCIVISHALEAALAGVGWHVPWPPVTVRSFHGAGRGRR